MAGGRSGGGVWLTGRDELALTWFAIVRIANVDSVRWLLGAVNGWDRPVQVRQAQRWVARMEVAGKVHRGTVGLPGGSVVWAASEVTGRRKPNLFAQTTRHEIAVSAASARFAAAGYAWRADEKPTVGGSHRADGVAIGIANHQSLIEVELTPKRAPRYAQIFSAYRRRLDRGDADRVVYLCTTDSAKAVRAALRQPALRPLGRRIDVHVEFSQRQAQWESEVLPPWLSLPDG